MKDEQGHADWIKFQKIEKNLFLVLEIKRKKRFTELMQGISSLSFTCYFNFGGYKDIDKDNDNMTV